MYEKVNITENHLRVLALFTMGHGREYYIREVEKLLKVSPRTAQLILGDLEAKGVLGSTTRGKIRSYRVKANIIARDYLLLTEAHKRIAFLGNNLVIREIVEKIAPHIHGVGLIFGSYAKGLQKKDSDLDVFVAGTYDKAAVADVSRTYGIHVSVKCYPMGIFEKESWKDILIKEVMDNHIIIHGYDDFIRVMVG